MRFSGCPACPGMFCLASTAPICQTVAGIRGLGSLLVGLCHLQCWISSWYIALLSILQGWEDMLLLSQFMSIWAQNVCYWQHYLKHITLTAQCKGNSGTCFWVVDSLPRLIYPAFGRGSSEGRSSWDLFEPAPRYLRPIKMAGNETPQRYSSRLLHAHSHNHNFFHCLRLPCRSYTSSGREVANWLYVKRLWLLKLEITF